MHENACIAHFCPPPRGANNLCFMSPFPWGGSTISVSAWWTDSSPVDLLLLRHETVNVEVRRGPVAPIVLRSKPAIPFRTPDLWRGAWQTGHYGESGACSPCEAGYFKAWIGEGDAPDLPRLKQLNQEDTNL